MRVSSTRRRVSAVVAAAGLPGPPRPRRSGANVLHNGGATVAELANRLGHRSEAAFARAFKRVVGVAPGSVKRVPALEIGALALPGPD